MGNSDSTELNRTSILDQTLNGLVHSPREANQPVNEQTNSSNGFHPMEVSSTNASDQGFHESVPTSDELGPSLDGEPAPLRGSTTIITEPVDFHQVLKQVEVQFFPFPGEFYCQRVSLLPDAIDVPKEISLYMITKDQTPMNQLQEVFGMIVDMPNSVDFDSTVFSSLKESIITILQSDIARNIKVLILHRVAIKGLSLSERFPELEVLYLHRVSLSSKMARGFAIYFCKNLKELHVILDQVVDDVTSLHLPRGLTKLKAYFDQTERAYKQALWICAYNIVSLMQM